MKARQHRRKPLGNRLRSACGSSLSLLSVLLLVWGGLLVGGIEICRHLGGEAHFFVSKTDCASLHSLQAGHSHASAGHGHHHDDGEHHEPCEHELLSADGEWLASASRLLTAMPDGDLAATALIPEFPRLSSEAKVIARLGDGRSPPGSAAGPRLFLKTIRFLV